MDIHNSVRICSQSSDKTRTPPSINQHSRPDYPRGTSNAFISGHFDRLKYLHPTNTTNFPRIVNRSHVCVASETLMTKTIGNGVCFFVAAVIETHPFKCQRKLISKINPSAIDLWACAEPSASCPKTRVRMTDVRLSAAFSIVIMASTFDGHDVFVISLPSLMFHHSDIQYNRTSHKDNS